MTGPVTRVTIIAIPRALGSGIAIPLEMLSAAADVARARGTRGRTIRIDIAGTEEGDVALAGGLEIRCRRTLDAIRATDLVFVPAVWRRPRRALADHPQIAGWLRRRHAAGATLCAVVTGAFFVAEAGLLDGRPATTHWRYFEEFQRAYPRAMLQRRRFITRADRIFCTGSVNAVRDITLHFIELLYGPAVAIEIARHFTHELKRSHESQLLDLDQRNTHHDEVIIEIQEWMQNNFHRDVGAADIAERFRLSIRSLNRRFRLAAGTTPLRYLQEVRIDHARQLLKSSNLSIAEVAAQVAYQNNGHFTGLFRRFNSLTPKEYRRLARGKLFAAEGPAAP